MCLLLLAAFPPLPVNGLDCVTNDGSKANTIEPCTCGNEECTTSTGLICYSTSGGGSCRENAPGPFGYPRSTNIKMCVDANVDGRGLILNIEACERAASRLGLSDTKATLYDRTDKPPGCSWSSGDLRFNLNVESGVACDQYGSRYCLCMVEPSTTCSNTNASIVNDVACLCGTAICASDTGLFCVRAFHTLLCLFFCLVFCLLSCLFFLFLFFFFQDADFF